MKPSQIVATDDYADFPAIAAAMAAIENAVNPEQLSAARDALRKAELERDIAKGFTDLWEPWEREHARKLGLI